MQAVVLSVPYSGTNFAATLFTGLGCERVGFDDPLEGNCVAVGHCLEWDMVEKALSFERPIVVPLRHPYRVEESFRRKGKAVDSLLAAYGNFLELAKFAGLPLPVDSDCRESYLQDIERVLGVEFHTEWPVVSSKSGTHGMRLADLDPSPAVRELVARNREFFGQFYELV